MFSGKDYIDNLFLKYIDPFIDHDKEKQKISVGFLAGEIEMSNVEIKEALLRHGQFLQLSYGHLSKVRIKLPWATVLYADSVDVYVDQIHVVLDFSGADSFQMYDERLNGFREETSIERLLCEFKIHVLNSEEISSCGVDGGTVEFDESDRRERMSNLARLLALKILHMMFKESQRVRVTVERLSLSIVLPSPEPDRITHIRINADSIQVNPCAPAAEPNRSNTSMKPDKEKGGISTEVGKETMADISGGNGGIGRLGISSLWGGSYTTDSSVCIGERMFNSNSYKYYTLRTIYIYIYTYFPSLGF